MFIQNVSMEAIRKGQHFDCGKRAVLIQIVDPGTEFPVAAHKFSEVHQFNFLDLEDNCGDLAEFLITDDQAIRIIQILKNALENRQHVIVHCHAGLCRSGAVAEIGIIMGFQDTGTFRMPNRLVKSKMMKLLGLSYD